MVAARCLHADPPAECPLRDWTPPDGLVCGFNPETKTFDLVKAFGCDDCGQLWTLEGEAIECPTSAKSST